MRTAARTTPTSGTPALSRQARLHRSAPRWIVAIPVAIAAGLLLLSGMIVSFTQTLSEQQDRGLPEQIFGVLASKAARVIALTGRSGASVRLVYDPIRNRGGLMVVRLPDLGDNLAYWLVLVKQGTRKAVASFRPASDRTTYIPIRANLKDYDAVAIAVGSSQSLAASARPVLQATLASSIDRTRPGQQLPPLVAK